MMELSASPDHSVLAWQASGSLHHVQSGNPACGSGSGDWEAAQKVARGYLPPEELHLFYSKRARSCEANRAWQDAEKAYVAAGELDMAVNMYKANKMWLPMLKIVQQHRREQLPQMHLLVAHVSSSIASVQILAQHGFRGQH
jgi:hypothetical protein